MTFNNTQKLLAGTLALVLVAGMTIPAYAGAVVETSSLTVAGEIIPIDNSSLFLAGIQSMTVWMVPAVLGLAGAGVYLVKFRANRD